MRYILSIRFLMDLLFIVLLCLATTACGTTGTAGAPGRAADAIVDAQVARGNEAPLDWLELLVAGGLSAAGLGGTYYVARRRGARRVSERGAPD